MSEGGETERPTNIEVETPHTEQVLSPQSTSNVPVSGSKSSVPSAASACGSKKIATEDEPDKGESGKGPSKSDIKTQIVFHRVMEREAEKAREEAIA